MNQDADVNARWRIRQRCAGGIRGRPRAGRGAAVEPGRRRQHARWILWQRAVCGIEEDHEWVVELLLNQGANLNAQGGDYSSAL
jgi:hypothetical protein